MAAGVKLEALWETFQTAVFPWLIGRFMGRKDTPTHPSGEGGKTEEPLKQQTTSVLNPRNDEAIQLAIDAALTKVPGGLAHLHNVQAVRVVLEPHQREDWRKNIGTLLLTERFEHVLASETITRGNAGGQNQSQAAAGQPPRGQEKIERKFERRPLDYEWTAQDPRVQHLVLVSKVVSSETTLKKGVAKARAYLLSAGLIAEQSPTEKAAASAKKGEGMVASAIYSLIGTAEAKAEVRRLEIAIKAAPNDAARQPLQENLRRVIVSETAAAKSRDQTNRQTLRLAAGIVVVILLTASVFWS